MQNCCITDWINYFFFKFQAVVRPYSVSMIRDNFWLYLVDQVVLGLEQGSASALNSVLIFQSLNKLCKAHESMKLAIHIHIQSFSLILKLSLEKSWQSSMLLIKIYWKEGGLISTFRFFLFLPCKMENAIPQQKKNIYLSILSVHLVAFPGPSRNKKMKNKPKFKYGSHLLLLGMHV